MNYLCIYLKFGILNPINHDNYNRLRNVTIAKEKTNTKNKNIVRVRNKAVTVKVFVIAHNHIKSLEKKSKMGR